jgi:hypothetical protein
MSGSLGQRDQVEETHVDDGKSVHELATKSKSSGKDDEGKLDGSQDSRMTFRAWLVRLDEQAVPFESMPDLNEAYVRLLKDATRCTAAFPEFL